MMMRVMIMQSTFSLFSSRFFFLSNDHHVDIEQIALLISFFRHSRRESILLVDDDETGLGLINSAFRQIVGNVL